MVEIVRPVLLVALILYLLYTGFYLFFVTTLGICYLLNLVGYPIPWCHEWGQIVVQY